MSNHTEPLVADEHECPSLMAELRTLGTLGQMWTLGVVVLCAARAVIVWPMLLEYGINPWWFLVLDVGTAPAYGVGQEAVSGSPSLWPFHRAKSRGSRLPRGSASAAASISSTFMPDSSP